MTVMLVVLGLAAALTWLLPNEHDNWLLWRWLADHSPERENGPAPFTGGGAVEGSAS